MTMMYSRRLFTVYMRFVLLLWLFASCRVAVAALPGSLLSQVGHETDVVDKTCYVLGAEQGLRGNKVLQIMQLGDGRMVVMTESHVNIYDGTGFRSVPVDASVKDTLCGYRGHTHLYVDARQRMWIKDKRCVACLDLKTLTFVSDCVSLVAGAGDKNMTESVDGAAADNVDDIFVDSDGAIWTVTAGNIHCADVGVTLALPAGCGTVQDLDVSGGRVFVFTGRGLVLAYSVDNGTLLYTSAAYGDDMADRYTGTSLIVRTADGLFHQIRTGSRCSIFQTFNPARRSWKIHFECDYTLHTLILSGSTAYITTPAGYMTYDTETMTRTVRSSLRLPDGTRISTGINTVCMDREGGVWLGTYGSGIMYMSPLSGVFDTGETDVRLRPLLTSVMLHGQYVRAGSRYADIDVPYIDSLHLGYDDNDIVLTFSAMKYVRPRSVYYRYRVVGLYDEWRTEDAYADSSHIDSRGLLNLSFTGLQPGCYLIEVMASPRAGVWTGEVCRLAVTVDVPWWRSTAAIALYVLLFILVSAMVVWLYVRGVKQRMARKAKEDMLLMRIRDLMDMCSRQESPVSVILADKEESDGKPEMSAAEMDFLNRATSLVEQHLVDTGYTVEQLSRDLCMERTGLYKKLMAILDKSPQMFIRSIRLRKAAELLARGGMAVGEVSEVTGFSSPSYFTKCFQKEYGCRPTEYQPDKNTCI